MAMYANGFILLLYCLAKIELFIETARHGEIKKRFDVLIKTPKRFTSNVETFLRCLSGRISRFLTIGYKSGFTSSGSSDLLIANALK